ncbi:HD domain-containing protein [Candidatus Daviesbacteria bacterium]|nr:HD domain-containing protein [Candidatus Daviesbacteria bacterium]
MSNFKDFYHYKGAELTPSEKVERKVIEILLNSQLPDSQRESSIVWEIKHSSGCVQIARVLAQKRNLDADIAATASLLHDIYVIVEGKYKDHAKLGAPIAEKILREIGGFSDGEIKTITDAVAHHSEKEVYTDNPYIEIVKDVDVFDCSFYKNAEGYYRLHKSGEIVREYENRIKKVREEFNLPPDPIFR